MIMSTDHVCYSVIFIFVETCKRLGELNVLDLRFASESYVELRKKARTMLASIMPHRPVGAKPAICPVGLVSLKLLLYYLKSSKMKIFNRKCSS